MFYYTSRGGAFVLEGGLEPGMRALVVATIPCSCPVFHCSLEQPFLSNQLNGNVTGVLIVNPAFWIFVDSKRFN